jgi:ribose-phosphate pyrophosphokinase
MEGKGKVTMELITKKKLMLFSGRANVSLAKEIAENLGVPLGEVELSTFANGEIYCRYLESIRGADVFIVQSHSDPINERIMEQLIMLDAAKRASAKRITAVCPFYGYSRQDKKTEGREPITAKLVADLLSNAGADRVVAVDLHTGQIQGFFDSPVDHLTALPILSSYLADTVEGDIVSVSPDTGRVKLAQRLADHLHADLAFVYKRRPRGSHNVAQALEVVGDVRGRPCILIDDMIDTAGTVTSAAELLMDKGAADVYVAATHGVLSGPAIDRLKNAPIKEVVLTNTLPIDDGKVFPELRVLSIAPIIADALDAVFEDTSVSQIFQGENI